MFFGNDRLEFIRERSMSDDVSTKPLVVVTGVGPGTGSAVVRRFATGGYRIAMLARDKTRLDALAAEIASAVPMACDVSDSAALERVLGEIDQRFGAPKVVVHNAVGGAFGKFQEIAREVLRANFETNAVALLHLARQVAPRMIEIKPEADAPRRRCPSPWPDSCCPPSPLE